MWSALLKSFLFFFILKLFVAVGNAYPTGSDIHPTRDNIMASINDKATSVTTSYECVYIPPNLDFCKVSSKENQWNSLNFSENFHKLLENKKLKLMESKINEIFMSHRMMHVPEMKNVQKKPLAQTIIYKLQNCIPSRLPFILPWCTDEDFSNKKSIYQIYPIAHNIVGLKEPLYDFSKFFKKI
ncbi:uncharacterized protein LOC105839887 [Monomorium pharaonis]|uniref:uncharacterized protein LOC105839887 n=1 Tax=Monomorium pharaonis TaxID=307658 RepID=UPI00063F86C1|nr:uncharacterized protein LOC105839887 [Monomorium pharaonis]XP_036149432.1 uncharacterized protein LOC105839887 [Monomorium pharaonis]